MYYYRCAHIPCLQCNHVIFETWFLVSFSFWKRLLGELKKNVSNCFFLYFGRLLLNFWTLNSLLSAYIFRVHTGHGKPGKSWNLIVDPWKSWKIKVLCDRLVASNDKARTMWDKERSDWTAWTDAFWWTEFVSVELFKVKKYPNTRKVLKIFESEN